MLLVVVVIAFSFRLVAALAFNDFLFPLLHKMTEKASVGAVFKEVMYVDTLVRDPISYELPSLTKACFPVPVSRLWSVSPFSSFAHTL